MGLISIKLPRKRLESYKQHSSVNIGQYISTDLAGELNSPNSKTTKRKRIPKADQAAN